MKNANLLWRTSLVFLMALLVCSITGCGGKTDEQASIKPADAYFPIKVGDRTVQMQLAVESLEMQRGLMGRRDIGANQGMVFVYRRPDRMGFYMRNTPTPLDIGFFDKEGVLREIYPMFPFDERSIKSRSDAIQYALEMNQGWYKANEVKPGAKLDLKALTAALKARGFLPEDFGLFERR